MCGSADGVSVPLRELEAYKIMHSSTGEPADLVQAWSSPLLAQGNIVMTDGQSKSKGCGITDCLQIHILAAQIYAQRVTVGAVRTVCA